MTEDAQRRVWAKPPAGAREAPAGPGPTDLQTLLLSLAQLRAAKVRPADVLRRWREDRFVGPSTSDPRAVAAVQATLWGLLPPEFDAVEQSPVAPIGTCAAVAPVSQNRIVTTMRSTEVVSDSTNALAVGAADRRLRQSADGEVHLAACHRLLRAQHFQRRPRSGSGEPGPAGWSSHFRLFTLASSARDTWTGQLMGNAKERCLVSCLSTERLAVLANR